MDDLPRFVETLQGKGVVGEIPAPTHIIRREAPGLTRHLGGFLILPLRPVRAAQIVICRGVSWVALNPLLSYLGCLIQFSRYIRIVGDGDLQLFPIAGVFPQLERLAEILSGPGFLGESV